MVSARDEQTLANINSNNIRESSKKKKKKLFVSRIQVKKEKNDSNHESEILDPKYEDFKVAHSY